MTNMTISLLIAGPAGVWIYSKLMGQTGGNTKSAAIGATVCAVVIFLLAIALTSTFFPAK